MPRDDRSTLEQMLDTATRIRALTRARTRDAFETDEVGQLALLHLIQRLGEGASRLSADFRTDHPEFPWAEMIGMRNRIVHGYDDVQIQIVEDVVRNHLGDLDEFVAAVKRHLDR